MHRDCLFTLANGCVQRKRRIASAATPPTPPIPRLIDRNAVQPGLQIGVATKLFDGLKSTQESFLCQVPRFLSVASQPEKQAINIARSFGDQLFKGGRVVAFQSFKELIFGPFKERVFRSRTVTD